MNWLDKHKPKNLSEFYFFKKEIEECKKWMINYKNKKENTPPILFIKGGSGLGKTVIAHVLLKEYHYDIIELNTTEFKGKKISEYLRKTLVYKNVIDMFYDGNRPIGLIMDEIDNFCKVADKGIINEFIQILKMNQSSKTPKIAKTSKTPDKIKKKEKNIDHIELYNPIICTSSELNDKKIQEIQKYSQVVHLTADSLCIENYISFIRHLYLIEGDKKIEDNVIMSIIEYSQGDIRRFIQIAEELYIYSNENEINQDMFDKYTNIYKEKEEDIQLIDATFMLLNEKLPIDKCQILFDVDCLQLPLMIYQNIPLYLKKIKESPYKWETYQKLMEIQCIHDTIQTNIFENQDWDILYDICSIYGSYLPNYIMHDVDYHTNYHTNHQKKNSNNTTKTIKNDKVKIVKNIEYSKKEIQSTTVLNKMSQMILNSKLLQNISPSFGKINKDYNEYIYIVKIINYYLDIFKKKESSDDDDNKMLTKPNLPIHQINQINDTFIYFLNYYKISIDMLENIIKLDKLNTNEVKKKKKFTVKLKKKINEHLVSHTTVEPIYDSDS